MTYLISISNVLSLMAITLSAQVKGTWPEPVSNEVIPYGVSSLTHGPVLGAPTSTSVRIWIRTRQSMPFRVVYDTVLPLDTNSPGADGHTRPEDDNTGVVELTKLKAGTRYYYGVALEGHLVDIRLDFQDRWPSFVTLPDESTCLDKMNNPKGLFNVCFSVGHCASQEREPSLEYGDAPAFQTLLHEHGHEVMFHIMNGDTIYEELRDGTMDGIRANYRLYWSRGRGFSRLRRYIATLYTYDDHEVGDNLFGSGFVGYGRGGCLVRDIGLKPWTEYCEWANYDSIHRGSIRFGRAQVDKNSNVLHDPDADFSTLDGETVSTIHIGPYTKGGAKPKPSKNAGVYGLAEIVDRHHLRVRPAFRVGGQVDYSIGTHHYFDWKLANCHFFALDTRGERGPFDKDRPNDPGTFILGERQRRWLTQGITKTDAEFIFIISPDPWVVHHTSFHMLLEKDPKLIHNPPRDATIPKGDGFASYLAERELVLRALDQTDKPIVVITGDVHNAMSIQITDNIWEILAGPLGSTRHPIGTCGNMPLGGKWNSLGTEVVVKWAAASPNNVPYTRNRNTYYVIVQVNNVMKTASPSSPGRQWYAYDAPNALVRFHDGYTGRLVYAETICLADFAN